MLFTSTEPSFSSKASATGEAGAFFIAVHVPAVNSWALAMLDQASIASRAIPIVWRHFIKRSTSHFGLSGRGPMRTSIDLPTTDRKGSPGQSNSSPNVGGLYPGRGVPNTCDEELPEIF